MFEQAKHGHRQIVFSDFGPWTCRWCETSGSEYTDPSDVPCDVPTEYSLSKIHRDNPLRGELIMRGTLAEIGRFLADNPLTEPDVKYNVYPRGKSV